MELKLVLEAMLFAAQKPLRPGELREALATAAAADAQTGLQNFKSLRDAELVAALEELAREHEQAQRSYHLVCVADAWQFVTRPEYAPWVRALVGQRARPPRLSQPALETLAIIAYRQPITRAEIEQVRGVNVDGVMQTLAERGLIQVVGRAEVVGRPPLYGTTPLFLEYFGLRSLADLPAADELRQLDLKKAAPPGLATAAPEPLTAAAPPAGAKPTAPPAEPSTGSKPETGAGTAAPPEAHAE